MDMNQKKEIIRDKLTSMGMMEDDLVEYITILLQRNKPLNLLIHDLEMFLGDLSHMFAEWLVTTFPPPPAAVSKPSNRLILSALSQAATAAATSSPIQPHHHHTSSSTPSTVSSKPQNRLLHSALSQATASIENSSSGNGDGDVNTIEGAGGSDYYVHGDLRMGEHFGGGMNGKSNRISVKDRLGGHISDMKPPMKQLLEERIGVSGKKSRKKKKKKSIHDRLSPSTVTMLTQQLRNMPDAAQRDASSVYVGNVDYSLSPDELAHAFADAGDVIRVTIPKGINGEPKGFAYIEFTTLEAATRALVFSGNLELNGRVICVRPKRTNVPYVQMKQRGETLDTAYDSMSHRMHSRFSVIIDNSD